MKRIMLGAAMLLLACSLAARTTGTPERYYLVGADVDANGHINATQVDPEVPASIAAVLAAAVKQWQFVPARLNGQPVPAHTFINTRLQALPNANGQYTVRVSFVSNGPRLYNKIFPQYPDHEAQSGQEAFALLDVTVQADGSLADMTVSSRFARWPLRGPFRSAVLLAARHWHATPERVDGQSVATHMRIPFNFTVVPARLTTRQAQILREAAQKDARAADAETSIPLPSDQAVALDSPLQPRAVATITNAP